MNQDKQESRFEFFTRYSNRNDNRNSLAALDLPQAGKRLSGNCCADCSGDSANHAWSVSVAPGESGGQVMRTSKKQSIDFPIWLHEWLQIEAAREFRSVNQQVIYLLVNHPSVPEGVKDKCVESVSGSSSSSPR